MDRYEMPEMTDQDLGESKPIGENEIKEAMQTLMDYKEGKNALDNKIVANEEWWKMRHWREINAQAKQPKPASAWMFNSLANKHADAMDNYPEPNVLPREQGDKEDAEALSHILPVVLQRNHFEDTYDKAWWYKLKMGMAIYGTFWNTSLYDGLGDIDIRKIDVLNLFWEPGVTDIQASKNVFHCELCDREAVEAQYPHTKGKLGTAEGLIATYKHDDHIDTSDKVVVVDWYYKRSMETDRGMDKTVLHYCKFVDGQLLFASENEPEYEDGWYNHGKYPFTVDILFPMEGMLGGLGYIDIMKDTQLSIDGMKSNIERYGLIATNPRYFVSESCNINIEKYKDPEEQFIPVAGNDLSDNRIRQMETEPLPNVYLSILQMNIDELKETSGNRDFSQGATTSGVTAASAIAALQEAGSKLSRDMIKGAYRAYADICYLCIELIRQFYEESREFRITGATGAAEFVTYDNSGIKGETLDPINGEETGRRVPIFDIEIVPQRASPFSKIANNELAKEMYAAGFFNPQMADQALIALDMMDFDGKNEIIQKVSNNGTMMQMMQQMQMQMAQMGQIIQSLTGQNPVAGIEAVNMGQPLPSQSVADSTALDAVNTATRQAEEGPAAKARKRAAEAATPL